MATLDQRIEHIRTLLPNRKNHGQARELIEEIREEAGDLPVTLHNFIDFLNGV